MLFGDLGSPTLDEVTKPPPNSFVTVEVLESCWGDWWVARDGRVVAVHQASGEDDGAFERATAQADELSGDFGYAVYCFGTVPRCCAGDYLVGEPGRV